MKKNTPFVITEDIRSITRGLPFAVTEKTARQLAERVVEICKKFITEHVILLSEKEMSSWLAGVVPQNALVQTLAYTDLMLNDYPQLQLTRANIWQESNPVQVPRYGHKSLESQLKSLEKGDYVLVDDVIFTGMGCREVILLGRELERNITKVIACVSIGMGKKQLDDLGVEIESLHHFESVIDEVCLRDFVPGLPFSGRPFVQNSNRFPFAKSEASPVIGEHRFIPYLLPWGDPHSRISVPKENEESFSLACLELAIEFWGTVAPNLKLREIPAKIYDPYADESMVFTRYLHQCREILEKQVAHHHVY